MDAEQEDTTHPCTLVAMRRRKTVLIRVPICVRILAHEAYTRCMRHMCLMPYALCADVPDALPCAPPSPSRARGEFQRAPRPCSTDRRGNPVPFAPRKATAYLSSAPSPPSTVVSQACVSICTRLLGYWATRLLVKQVKWVLC